MLEWVKEQKTLGASYEDCLHTCTNLCVGSIPCLTACDGDCSAFPTQAEIDAGNKVAASAAEVQAVAQAAVLNAALKAQLDAANAAKKKAAAPSGGSKTSPAPAAETTTYTPTAPASNTIWWVLGGAAVLGGVAWLALGRGGAMAAMKANPTPLQRFLKRATAAVYRVRLNSQGYDSRGRYFGVGLPLYEYVAQDSFGEYIATDHIRATDRNHAKDLVRRRLSGYDVKFTR